MINPDAKLVVVVGATASGKTDLAVRLAKKYDGEVVCADSRTVYRHMDIGTAKPTPEEQAGVPHHLLDVIEPTETLSAARFKQLADESINDIWSRGKVPFLVGGSGLYVDAVVYEYEFPPEADPKLRSELEKLTDDALRHRLETADAELFAETDINNRRRLIRAIEVAGRPRFKRADIRPNTLMLAPDMDKELVKQRVKLRIDKMVEAGFLDEVRFLGERYGLNCAGFDVIGYRAFKGVVFGNKPLSEGIQPRLRRRI